MKHQQDVQIANGCVERKFLDSNDFRGMQSSALQKVRVLERLHIIIVVVDFRIECLRLFSELLCNVQGLKIAMVWCVADVGHQMGRAKVLTKKLPIATPKEVLESTSSNPVPVQRKRGRPRKVAKEELPVEE
ncbi:hypothetical protein AXG93_3468s1170 [Marchantia polymorpha subsp. ruderalis]|uniref:Uncharacterized protein n=1 Tax=Marchantia polymorpha subsp. ruderalis TaxID=1480154 RepID=A0A176WH75_MARPO|nr:hypothetical protein AXG93_3468s1170 [Marchantia polymorpha subsp. ruderalis]